MSIIPQIAAALQDVFSTTAYSLGRSSGFIQRQGKLNGASFVQTLVFSFLANPDATGAELTQTAAALGLSITEPGLTQRFTPQAATLLQQVLAAAIKPVLRAEPLESALLERFSAVYLEDSSVIVLPDELRELWPGCGNAQERGTASLKLCLRLDLRSGRLDGLSLNAGRTADLTAAAPLSSIEPQALYLADLGFFKLKRLSRLAEQGALFLSRLSGQNTLFSSDGQRWDDLAALLSTQNQAAVDLAVELGVRERLKLRLLAVRVPQEVVDARRRKIRAEAARRGHTPSARQLALAAWTVFVTNVPAELLSIEAALVLGRVRWQIELLFKRWKSQGKLDQTRSGQAWRVLTELYAKLLALLIQHWVSLISLWGYRDRSLSKAMKVVQKYAIEVVEWLWDSERVSESLARMARVQEASCRMGRRGKRPHSYQVLLEAEEHLLA
jgi:hypothetical protein